MRPTTLAMVLLFACSPEGSDDTGGGGPTGGISGATGTGTGSGTGSGSGTGTGTGTGTGSSPADADGDGWFTPEDCDDGDPYVNPGAKEICNNGVDDDCDGGPGPCGFSGEIPASEAIRLDGVTDEMVGFKVAEGRDLNGDGLPELLVAGDNCAYLASSPFAPASLYDVADLFLAGEAEEDHAAMFALDFIADVDGDGLADLVVGAPDAGVQQTGAVYLLSSSLRGRHHLDEVPAITWIGDNTRDRLGLAALSVGDVSGDGIEDLGIAARGHDAYGGQSGTVGLFFGPTFTGGSLYQADAGIYGSYGTNLGENLVGDMDLDGDGAGDVAVAVGSQHYGGSIAAFRGPFSGLIRAEDAAAWLLAEYGAALYPFAALALASPGDTDGDGLDDLLIGAPGASHQGMENAGVAYLVLGMPEGEVSLFEADTRIGGDRAERQVGVTLAAAGDLDLDGRADFLVGEPHDRSRAHLFYGPVLGIHDVSEADAAFVAPVYADGYHGWGMGPAGDADGDGLPDLWIGTHGFEAGGPYAGAVHLYLGYGL